MLQEQQAQAAVSAAVEEKNRMYMESVSTLWLNKCHSSYILNSFHNINNSKQKDFCGNLDLKCMCTLTLLIKIDDICTCTKIAPN